MEEYLIWEREPTSSENTSDITKLLNEGVVAGSLISGGSAKKHLIGILKKDSLNNDMKSGMAW
jgi:hypothetical protein